MPRKLVTVRKISSLAPVPNDDNLQTATVDGWVVLVSKADFDAPGQLGVFFEADSLLPASDTRWARFEHAFKSYNDPPTQGYRVKTTTIKGHISDGLLLPLALFPEIQEVVDKLVEEHGEEEAEKQWRSMPFEDVLGVTKYVFAVADEEPTDATTTKKKKTLAPEFIGYFPDFVPKTDQERIQNIQSVFQTKRDVIFQESTKMDGQSITIYFLRNDSQHTRFLPDFELIRVSPSANQPNGRVGVCSRNCDLAPVRGCLPWTVIVHLGLPETLSKLNRNLAIQGELCGATIQRNTEGFARGEHDFFLFAVYDIDEKRYIDPKVVEEEWAEKLGVKHVPVTGYFRLEEVATSAGELVKRAEGTGVNGRRREGIVLKEVGEDGWMGRNSFKAIAKEFLLKEDATDKKRTEVDVDALASRVEKQKRGKSKR